MKQNSLSTYHVFLLHFILSFLQQQKRVGPPHLCSEDVVRSREDEPCANLTAGLLIQPTAGRVNPTHLPAAQQQEQEAEPCTPASWPPRASVIPYHGVMTL